LVGDAPKALVYNPTNNRIYCANYEGNSVSVIDGTKDTVVVTLPVKKWPKDIGYNSLNNKVYTANHGDSSVSVIKCYPGVDVPYEENGELAREFLLNQNYPNPFNLSTTIPFTVCGKRITENGPIHTTLTVYNILGQKVKILVDEPRRAGKYKIVWDGKDESGNEVASGVYLYRIKTKDFLQTKKMLLIR